MFLAPIVDTLRENVDDVPKHNQTISSVLSPHKRANGTEGNIKLQDICGLLKRTLPTFILPVGLGL